MDIIALREKIVRFVQLNGPIIPAKVAKETGLSVMFASAMLSELVARKVFLISYGKIGGSPIYYCKGQEPKLEMLYNYLPPREKEAFMILKEKKLVKDTELGPVYRAAVREIKDFAVPIEADVGEGTETFWSWHLNSKQEVSDKLDALKVDEATKGTELVVEDRGVKQEELKGYIEEKTYEEKLQYHELKKVKKTKKEKKVREAGSNFLNVVERYLVKNNIEILERKSIKKKDVEMLANIKSQVGELKFLVIAKDKKRISESDLSLAYDKGQMDKSFVLFLTNGELTKKGRENLKAIVFRRIE